MHSEELYARIQYLEEKITQLLKHHKDQREMIQQLRKAQEHVTQQRTNGEVIVRSSPESLAMSTIAKSKHSIKDWEAKLERYISEVDKIIAYLEHPQ